MRRLLQAGTPAEQQRRWAWSHWRRRHQATAQCCHTERDARYLPNTAGGDPVIVQVPGTARLTTQGWTQILPILPPQKPATGRPANDHRRTLEGMLWVMHTGAAWREVPASFGPWHTLHSRYHRNQAKCRCSTRDCLHKRLVRCTVCSTNAITPIYRTPNGRSSSHSCRNVGPVVDRGGIVDARF